MTVYDIFLAPFADYGFMRRALIACICLGLGSGPIGVFLMLRRMSLMGDAMSHAVLPGAAIGYLVAGSLSLTAMLGDFRFATRGVPLAGTREQEAGGTGLAEPAQRFCTRIISRSVLLGGMGW